MEQQDQDRGSGRRKSQSGTARRLGPLL